MARREGYGRLAARLMPVPPIDDCLAVYCLLSAACCLGRGAPPGPTNSQRKNATEYPLPHRIQPYASLGYSFFTSTPLMLHQWASSEIFPQKEVNARNSVKAYKTKKGRKRRVLQHLPSEALLLLHHWNTCYRTEGYCKKRSDPDPGGEEEGRRSHNPLPPPPPSPLTRMSPVPAPRGSPTKTPTGNTSPTPPTGAVASKAARLVP